MKRIAILLLVAAALLAAYAAAHWALIEVGREVIVLRTEQEGGGWLETRLWIVDAGGFAWLHGADSAWMRNLRARPIVEVERGGETRRYRAQPVPGPHPEIDAALRAKYGVSDRWVRVVAPDGASTMPVRLEPLSTP